MCIELTIVVYWRFKFIVLYSDSPDLPELKPPDINFPIVVYRWFKFTVFCSDSLGLLC